MKSTASALILGILISASPAAQERGPRPHLSTPSFIYARYASASSSSVYAVYTLGPAGVVLGMVINPRTGYRELVGGVASRLAWRNQSVTVALAGADAPESTYFQTYLLPRLIVAGATVTATLEIYHPLERAGSSQLYLNPLAVVLRPAAWFGLGGVYTLGLSSGRVPGHRLGPMLELDIPRGAVKMELLHSLFRGDLVSVADVRCRNPERACRGEEQADAYELVFVRFGLFVKHSGRNRIFADLTQALFFSPSECYRVSHPAGSGDDCTILAFSSPTVREIVDLYGPALAGPADSGFPTSHVPVDTPLIWRYQHLRRALLEGWTSPLEAEENALGLLEAVLSAALPGGFRISSSQATVRRRREIVEVTRTALASHPGAQHSLTGLAASVGCSPFHLTRVFRDETGIPVHQYLNRLRLAAAIERLASGEENISALAFELGFSSHSHLTRIFRRSFGVVPSAFRRRKESGVISAAPPRWPR